MHPEKIRIVYCKDADRKKMYPNVSFDFLGYTFRSRKSRNRQGKCFTGFLPAISDKACKAIHEKIREWKLSGRSGSDINTIAAEINPVLKGWINYYGHYYKSELQDVLGYLNLILKKWARQKYKKLHSHKTKAGKWLAALYQAVSILKKDGSKRVLGLPTLLDRIAQQVVRVHLEKYAEPHFHQNSYGYRAGKSMHDALHRAKFNCGQYPYVITLDIKSYFDTIPHDKLLKAIEFYCKEKWESLYVSPG